jgi:hypothetical protein
VSIDLIIGTAFRLNTSLEALAALGARLRLLADHEPGHPAVTPLLDGAVDAMGLSQALQTLSAEQARTVADAIRAFFLQAADLMERPQRAPGWVFDDPTVLQSQGRASSIQPALIASCAPQALSPDQTAALLTEGGFAQVSVLPRPWKAPLRFVAGRRPSGPVAGSH